MVSYFILIKLVISDQDVTYDILHRMVFLWLILLYIELLLGVWFILMWLDQTLNIMFMLLVNLV